MTLVPFTAANEIGDRFLALLSRLQIDPPVRSSVENELLSLTGLIEVMKNPALATGADAVTILREAAGIHDLAAKVLAIETTPEFQAFIPHLRLIAQSKGTKAGIGQNARILSTDDTDRKMVELYLGTLAVHAGRAIKLDPPRGSKGDNPDVMFIVDVITPAPQTREWALAIKTISSSAGQTIFERIAEGAGQINAPSCPADVGMVVINCKNALDHDALWKTPFADLDAAKAALNQQLGHLIAQAEHNRPQAEWDSLFQHKVVRPILFLGQSLVRIDTTLSAQTPTALKLLIAYGAHGALDPVAEGLGHIFNDAMQLILRGVPGSGTQPPR